MTPTRIHSFLGRLGHTGSRRQEVRRAGRSGGFPWRRTLLVCLAGVALLIGCAGAPEAGAQTATLSSAVRRVPALPAAPLKSTPRPAPPVSVVRGQVQGGARQTIDGFGVSGAWWPADLAQFPAGAQAQLESLLFSPSGLEVSQYRYLIGSGGVGVLPGHQFKTAPSFLTTARTYDWQADPAGLSFLTAAEHYGVADLVAFVNSAPAVLTSNHKSCGDTLGAAEVKPYAAFLTAVVGHLIRVEGLPVKYLSPMNEPTDAHPECFQEGMAVAPATQATLVTDLAADLRAADLHVGIIANESQTTGALFKTIDQWYPQVRSDVAVLADHNYNYPSPTVLTQVDRLDAPHWATEICCRNAFGQFGPGYDPTMSSGLWLAQTIYEDLVDGGYSAFDWWLAASPHMGCDPASDASCADSPNVTGANDGLVYFDPSFATDHDYDLYLTKRYWALWAYSRYVRPGAVLHLVSGLPSSVEAVSFAEGSKMVTVVINLDDQPHLLELSPPPGTSWSLTRAYQTDESVSGRPAPVLDGPAALGGLRVEIPAGSVTTLVSPSV